uniref:Uncharacterized protein n=1 Tax=Oryza rufipogon TaxID=4529 RepID=A0A0E0R3E0_ORYRU
MGRACLGDEGKRGDGDARTWAMAQLRVSWRESRRAVRGAAWRGAGPGTTRHGRDDAGAGVGPARCDAWRDTTRCGCGAASAVRLGLGSDAAEGKEARLRCSTGVTGTAGSDVVHAVDGIERLADRCYMARVETMTQWQPGGAAQRREAACGGRREPAGADRIIILTLCEPIKCVRKMEESLAN